MDDSIYFLNELSNSGYIKEDVQNNPEARKEIIRLFQTKDEIDDDDVHQLSDKLGIDTHEFEEIIYKLLSNLLKGGKSAKFHGDYDETELQMGIEIEQEHTTDKEFAKKIAKDHLAEIPDYYTRLKKMEQDAKGEKGMESKRTEKKKNCSASKQIKKQDHKKRNNKPTIKNLKKKNSKQWGYKH